MSTSSGRHSGCSTSRAARRGRSDTWEAICLLPDFRTAADDRTLPDSHAGRARPVIDFVAGMELDRVPRVIARVSAGTTATSPGGLGARAAESDAGDEQHEHRSPVAHHDSRSEEKMITARRISPPRRTSTGPIARRGPGARNRIYRGSAIPPSTITASRRPQPFSHTVAILPSETSSPAIRSEEHTSELQSQSNLVCRLLLEKKKKKNNTKIVSKATGTH